MENINEKIQAINEAIKELEKIEVLAPEVKDTVVRLEKISNKLSQKEKNDYKNEAWEKVNLARKLERPRGRFFIETIVTDFIECHGDRQFGDDPAIIGGIGKIGEHVVSIIAQNKGNTSKENIATNFGMPHPEGYHKALRLMKQAEKFNRPVICLIDTPGAYCGLEAEERGQGAAIAQNLFEMARLKTPIISGIIGEGGSGGALALGVADRIFMQENAIYSILSPEGFASILWKDASKAKEAASQMKLTAQELLKFGIIDDIILEPEGGAHIAPLAAADAIKQYLIMHIEQLKQEPINILIDQRYERFRKYGEVL